MLLQNAAMQRDITAGAHSHAGVSDRTHHEKHQLKQSHSSLWPVTHGCSGQTMAIHLASGFAPPLQTQWEPEACWKHPSRPPGVIFVNLLGMALVYLGDLRRLVGVLFAFHFACTHQRHVFCDLEPLPLPEWVTVCLLRITSAGSCISLLVTKEEE